MEMSDKVLLLIAEDDSETREALNGQLVQWGYGVVEASNGQQGWEQVKLESWVTKIMPSPVCK